MTASNATAAARSERGPGRTSPDGVREGLKRLLGGNLRQYGMLGALVALSLFFQIASGGKMLTPSNAQNILNGNSYVLVLAIGMLFVIITGQIDLSVGSVAAVVGICTAL